MLLDPSFPSHSAKAPALSSPTWSRKQPLTRAEEARSDTGKAAILEKHDIDFRPIQETSLLVLSTGVEHRLPNLKERPIFAVHHRRRVAEMALTFDAFRQGQDLGNLRLVGLRPVEGKAPLGGLDEAFTAFSRAYNTHVGRLVTAGTIEPVLTAIHIRFDVALGAWDLHAHALWNVSDANIDAMWIGLGTHFSDKWMDGERVERPGAAANYCLSWTIDHREIMNWPEEAVLELWDLERPALDAAGWRLPRPSPRPQDEGTPERWGYRADRRPARHRPPLQGRQAPRAARQGGLAWLPSPTPVSAASGSAARS